MATGKYGWEHEKRAKRTWEAIGTLCTRCGLVITAADVDAGVHLDHNDAGDAYLGWAHAVCNTRAGGAKRNLARMMREKESPIGKRPRQGVPRHFGPTLGEQYAEAKQRNPCTRTSEDIEVHGPGFKCPTCPVGPEQSRCW